MTPRAAIALALGILVAAVLLRGQGAGPAPAPPPRRARTAPPARLDAAPPPPPARNVFEYAERAPATFAPAPAATSAAPSPTASPVEDVAPAVRLVGLVRRGGVLKAALSIHGETVVVGPGDAAGDYRVVAVDEDGVRLRAADGSMITLVTPSP
jgi:hypothetical protein